MLINYYGLSNGAVSWLHYKSQNYVIINRGYILNYVERLIVSYMKLLSQNSAWGIEENHYKAL
jgi:hypothetical protein